MTFLLEKRIFSDSLGPDKVLYALYLGEANSTVLD